MCTFPGFVLRVDGKPVPPAKPAVAMSPVPPPKPVAAGGEPPASGAPPAKPVPPPKKKSAFVLLVTC